MKNYLHGDWEEQRQSASFAALTAVEEQGARDTSTFVGDSTARVATPTNKACSIEAGAVELFIEDICK